MSVAFVGNQHHHGSTVSRSGCNPSTSLLLTAAVVLFYHATAFSFSSHPLPLRVPSSCGRVKTALTMTTMASRRIRSKSLRFSYPSSSSFPSSIVAAVPVEVPETGSLANHTVGGITAIGVGGFVAQKDDTGAGVVLLKKDDDITNATPFTPSSPSLSSSSPASQSESSSSDGTALHMEGRVKKLESTIRGLESQVKRLEAALVKSTLARAETPTERFWNVRQKTLVIKYDVGPDASIDSMYVCIVCISIPFSSHPQSHSSIFAHSSSQ